MLNNISIGSWLFPSVSPAEFDETAPQRAWFKASLVAAAAFLICMALADRRGLWLDEFFTLKAARGFARLKITNGSSI